MFIKGYLKCAMWMNEMTFLDLNGIKMEYKKKVGCEMLPVDESLECAI